MVNEHSDTFVATGDINPCRFVKAGTTDSNQVTECDANEDAIGVSQEASRSFDSALAAIDGDSLRVHLMPGECLLELGGTVDEGGLLKSDADGKGVAVATTGTTKQLGRARARQAGVSGNKIRVVLLHNNEFPALS